jgi:transcriptional regulator with XRE-family HTH domain
MGLRESEEGGGSVTTLDELTEAIAKNMRRLRETKGWTMTRLAEEIDVHLSWVSTVESGRGRPSLDKLFKLAKAFGVQPSAILDNGQGSAMLESLLVQLDEREREDVEDYMLFKFAKKHGRNANPPAGDEHQDFRAA